MKDSITKKEIQTLDRVWHELVVALQKTSEELWDGQLEGVSTVEISILSIVEKRPDVILKEIIEILGIPGSTLTNAINRLEKRGLLRRTISPRDRRSYGLELTDKGRLAQQEHVSNEEILWQKILSSYETSGERRELMRLLEILADNLNHKKRDENSHE